MPEYERRPLKRRGPLTPVPRPSDATTADPTTARERGERSPNSRGERGERGQRPSTTARERGERRPSTPIGERGERSPNSRGERGQRPSTTGGERGTRLRNPGVGLKDQVGLRERTQQSLRSFFQRPLVRKMASVLIPGLIAAILLPVFGSAIAAGAAAVTVQNSLKLLGIDLSPETTEKLLKPLEGKQLEGSDVQAILEDTLKTLLPEDKQVNEEATRVVIVMVSEIKQAAVASSNTDLEWLRTRLETSLKEQGGKMAEMASQLSALVVLHGEKFKADRERLLAEVNGH